MERKTRKLWITPQDWIEAEVRKDGVHITSFNAANASLLRQLIDDLLVCVVIPIGYQNLIYECRIDDPCVKDFIDIGFGGCSDGEFCCLEYELPFFS